MTDRRRASEDLYELKARCRSDPRLAEAALVMQRWWRVNRYTWLAGTPRVQLPPSPSDLPDVPTAHTDLGGASVAAAQSEVAWHSRLTAAFRQAKAAALSGNVTARLQADLEYCQEVGKFAAACRMAAVLAVRETILDPHGAGEELGDTTAMESGGRLPRRITPQDAMWPLVRPRFDGDRVYVVDSIVVTLVGGNVGGKANGGTDQEGAWKLYAHDVNGMQALADAISVVPCLEPVVPPVAVMVDYLGFRGVCRPQVLRLGGPPPEFVIGPLQEAATAYGAPDDFPTLLRQQAHLGQHAGGLLLHEWDQRHPALRKDLERIADELCCEGYPVALISDLPPGSASTALLRVASGPGGAPEYHFRTPAELFPPEVTPSTRQADPMRRLRREALHQLYSPPLPPTFSGASARAGTRTTGPSSERYATDGQALQEVAVRAKGELPKRLLLRLGDEGPPLDSRGWTEALHAAGVNMRHIGEAAASASLPAASALHREALARSAKWLLRKALWKRLPWAVLAAHAVDEEQVGAIRVAEEEVVALFNLVLGSGVRAIRFWDEVLVPEAVRRFGVPASAMARRKIIPRALFHAMEYHCRVHFHKSSDQRPFFHPAHPEPLLGEDLSIFHARYAAPLFPHLGAVQKIWADRLASRAGFGLEVPSPPLRVCQEWRGFSPSLRIACARGAGWAAAVSSSARHVREGHWDRACDAKKVELAVVRALGECPEVVGNVMQGVAVALLEVAKRRASELRKMALESEMGGQGLDHVTVTLLGAGDTKGGADAKLLKDVIYAADLASFLLPHFISVWWAQLAAAEAEWLLERRVAAETRLQRLRHAWERCAADQPVLLLRLEGTCARLFACQADWPAAALHTERCARIAERAFGSTHPATVALSARLGDCWARREDWARSARAYQQALACGEAGGDEAVVARLSYELAQVLFKKGDLAASKPYAEQAAKLLLPRFAREGLSGPQGLLALESLHFLAQVYEAISMRAWAAPGGAGIPTEVRFELTNRTIRCYENFLRHLAVEAPPAPGKLSRPAAVIESIVRLKALMMGDGERNALIDAIEELLMSKSFQDFGDGVVRGIRSLQPRAETRAIAEAALRSRTSERPDRLRVLYEAVAKEAILNELDPSDWFDETIRKMSEGFAGVPNPDDPGYQATLTLLDIYRYFGSFTDHVGGD